MVENKNPQEMYEEYRMKFATMYNHTIEKATVCQAVKDYKHYLERVYGVTINESVN